MSQVTQQIERKPIYCRNNCGIEITFDSRKSKSGKSIPIDKSSGLPHQCPKNPYNQQKTGGTISSNINSYAKPMQQVEQQTTNTLLHEILFEIGELKKTIEELQK